MFPGIGNLARGGPPQRFQCFYYFERRVGDLYCTIIFIDLQSGHYISNFCFVLEACRNCPPAKLSVTKPCISRGKKFAASTCNVHAAVEVTLPKMMPRVFTFLPNLFFRNLLFSAELSREILRDLKQRNQIFCTFIIAGATSCAKP